MPVTVLLIVLQLIQPAAPCWDDWTPACTVAAVVIGARLGEAGLVALHEIPLVPGAGAILNPPDIPAVCSVTPSTGQGSGVYIRALPDADAEIVGDLPLAEYRPVSAISSTWYQTETRGGRVGFVAANVSALVGACGDVPRFVVTR